MGEGPKGLSRAWFWPRTDTRVLAGRGLATHSGFTRTCVSSRGRRPHGASHLPSIVDQAQKPGLPSTEAPAGGLRLQGPRPLGLDSCERGPARQRGPGELPVRLPNSPVFRWPKPKTPQFSWPPFGRRNRPLSAPRLSGTPRGNRASLTTLRANDPGPLVPRSQAQGAEGGARQADCPGSPLRRLAGWPQSSRTSGGRGGSAGWLGAGAAPDTGAWQM